jgi:hypothetical protein
LRTCVYKRQVCYSRGNNQQEFSQWVNSNPQWFQIEGAAERTRQKDRPVINRVRTYGSRGDGIGILYQRGVGVTNLNRLHTGAGVGFTGLQQGVNYFGNK